MVVHRGQCTFNTKALVLQRAGALGMVVVDNNARFLSECELRCVAPFIPHVLACLLAEDLFELPGDGDADEKAVTIPIVSASDAFLLPFHERNRGRASAEEHVSIPRERLRR